MFVSIGNCTLSSSRRIFLYPKERGTDAISDLLFRLLSPSALPFCSLPAFLLFLPVLFSWALGGGGVRVWTLNIFVSVKDVKLRRGMIHSFSASPRPYAISTCLKDATKTQVFPLGKGRQPFVLVQTFGFLLDSHLLAAFQDQDRLHADSCLDSVQGGRKQ